jgi:UDP-N-acetylglucosamine:LPS N-acetylglucosamine transferase
MNSTTADSLSIILVSPNVSEQMGGEAIKALQIYLELKRQGVRVHQITHDRVKLELDRKYPDIEISYLPDTKLEQTFNRIGPLSPFLGIIFLWRATRLAKQVLKARPGSISRWGSCRAHVGCGAQTSCRAGLPVVLCHPPLDCGLSKRPSCWRAQERKLTCPTDPLNRRYAR